MQVAERCEVMALHFNKPGTMNPSAMLDTHLLRCTPPTKIYDIWRDTTRAGSGSGTAPSGPVQ
jgi:hypothetical protein